MKNGINHSNAKTQKYLEICRNWQYTIRPEVFNSSRSVVSIMFFKAKSAKNTILLFGDFRPLPNKKNQIWNHFFSILFPKDSESLKSLDIQLREVGAKKRFKRYLKSEQTDRHTDRRTNRLIESFGPEGRCFDNSC